MQTREQQYAGLIFHQILDYSGKYASDTPECKQYGAMAHQLPVLVRTAGLAQALAFANSRKEPHRELLGHLAAVVNEENVNQLLARSRSAELAEYIYLTERVLSALTWYKRFAQSVLNVSPTTDPEGGDNG